MVEDVHNYPDIDLNIQGDEDTEFLLTSQRFFISSFLFTAEYERQKQVNDELEAIIQMIFAQVELLEANNRAPVA
jgi:hypothetical protein